jgi:hypothetical protein
MLALPVWRAHGRRVTKAYPLTPNTTGIIINMPNTVLITVFSIPLCRCIGPATHHTAAHGW